MRDDENTQLCQTSREGRPWPRKRPGSTLRPPRPWPCRPERRRAGAKGPQGLSVPCCDPPVTGEAAGQAGPGPGRCPVLLSSLRGGRRALAAGCARAACPRGPAARGLVHDSGRRPSLVTSVRPRPPFWAPRSLRRSPCHALWLWGDEAVPAKPGAPAPRGVAVTEPRGRQPTSGGLENVCSPMHGHSSPLEDNSTSEDENPRRKNRFL